MNAKNIGLCVASLLVGSAVTWPFVARAQVQVEQQPIPVVLYPDNTVTINGAAVDVRMPRFTYEYMAVKRSSLNPETQNGLQSALNKHGSAGWELVRYSPEEETVLFKRAVQVASPEGRN